MKLSALSLLLAAALPMAATVVPRPYPARAVPASASPLDEPAPQAPITLLVDLNSGQTLFARDEHRRFIPASITKVMTVFVAFELIEQGRLEPSKLVTVSNAAFKQWHRVGSTMFLGNGAQITVNDLLLGITTVSANDACIVLAEGAAGSVDNWVAMMNAQAAALGMKDSHFGRPNGWMDGGSTYTSARDLAVLAQALITRHPELYRRYFGHPGLSYGGIAQPNHDPILGVVPGADGLKTGFTNEAGYGFLGSAERDGRRLVMVVAGSASGRERAQDARQLIEWGFATWQSKLLLSQGNMVGTARVQGGDARSVSLIASRNIGASGRSGAKLSASARIVYRGPLPAPIAKGSHVADLVLTVDGKPGGLLPLLAGESIGRAGPLDRLVNGLAGLLP